MALGIMNEYQKEKFKQTNEVDLAYGVPGLGRFRVNVFQQRGGYVMALRLVKSAIRTFAQLHLPETVRRIAERIRAHEGFEKAWAAGHGCLAC